MFSIYLLTIFLQNHPAIGHQSYKKICPLIKFNWISLVSSLDYSKDVFSYPVTFHRARFAGKPRSAIAESHTRSSNSSHRNPDGQTCSPGVCKAALYGCVLYCGRAGRGKERWHGVTSSEKLGWQLGEVVDEPDAQRHMEKHVKKHQSTYIC